MSNFLLVKNVNTLFNIVVEENISVYVKFILFSIISIKIMPPGFNKLILCNIHKYLKYT